MRAIHDEQPQIGRRHDRRGSGLPIDQAHLAEDSHPGCIWLPAPTGVRTAAVPSMMMKNESPGVADLRDNRPRGRLDDPRELGDPAKLVLVEPAEERHALQMPQLRIAGRLGRAGECRRLDLDRIVKGWDSIDGSWVQLHDGLLSSGVPAGSARHEGHASPLA